jgi:hypothetical protein
MRVPLATMPSSASTVSLLQQEDGSSSSCYFSEDSFFAAADDEASLPASMFLCNSLYEEEESEDMATGAPAAAAVAASCSTPPSELQLSKVILHAAISEDHHSPSPYVSNCSVKKFADNSQFLLLLMLPVAGAVLRPFCRIKRIFKSCRCGDQQTE